MNNIFLTFILLWSGVVSVRLQGQVTFSPGNLTADQIIHTIIQKTRVPEIPNTVDVIKEGNKQVIVTGVTTCMFATMDVLKQSVLNNCNLIIAHEPLYYNHLDDPKKLLNDPVYVEKKKFILQNKLVVWRFHDYIHSMKPDGIVEGMVEKLGWQEYVINNNPTRFRLPGTTLKVVLKNLAKKFPATAFYVVGNPDMKLSTVCLAEGAPGSDAHIRILEDKDVDVLIAGESQQWETYEYARDAVQQGKNKAVIFLGHIPSEEAGMEWCSRWLRTFIHNIPISFIECKSSYWSY